MIECEHDRATRDYEATDNGNCPLCLLKELGSVEALARELAQRLRHIHAFVQVYNGCICNPYPASSVTTYAACDTRKAIDAARAAGLLQETP